ncbi:MAG: hypothetical protein JWO36_5261 [Myxococcales bacterium]|nr:hypothetical protein [Myxococcales bacterium]
MLKPSFVAGMLVLASAGCGLISSDVTNFDLTLPNKTFSVDTGSWNVSQSAADAYLMHSCTTSQVCSSAVAAACSTGCAGECDATSHTCDLDLQVAVHQGVDLVTEKPELKTINDQPLIKVAIDSVQYEVALNTLTVATPAMKIYVAPISVMDPNDPMAKQVGLVESIPAMTLVTRKDMTFSDGSTGATSADQGRQNLIDAMSSYKVPFNVLIGTQLVVKMGSSVPMGKLDAIIHIKAHAGL